MDFVTHSNVLGVESKEIPTIPGVGAPTAATVGAVGCLYMDTDTGALYKCIAAVDGVYTWVAADKPAATDAKYFDIDVDGVISLKPEYRGHPDKTTYPYAVSNNGINLDGDKINELPRNIVIPEYINGIAVTGFQPGMFHYNYRVKSITLPDGVSELPDYFCRYAINLEAVNNTEGITKLGKSAISYTRIEKALFPNLVELATTALASCRFLRIVDIGNNITAIPNQCFQQSVSLERVKGGAKVQTIGNNAFDMTRSLKNLSFLPNVTSIGQWAFYRSRIQFDWSSLDGKCDLTQKGATPVNDNTTPYWLGVTHTANEHRLGSMFSIQDDRIKGEYIGATVDGFGGSIDRTNGTRIKYEKACSFLTLINIHTALTGTTYNHPDDFIRELLSRPEGEKFAALLSEDVRYIQYSIIPIIDALGYEITVISTGDMDEASYNSMYEAMQNKPLVRYSGDITQAAYQAMCDALGDKTNPQYVYTSLGTKNDDNEGHSAALYGMTANKEALFADNDFFFESYRDSDLGVSDDLYAYKMPYQNMTGPQSEFFAVRKKLNN
ncbi:MAG: leucine-rich repeat domain-containing protein [Ruminococcaceae bacterium]|nr:leucine-rich repeat domain-containing protein [Oscillospiraceae bacterium]